MDIQLLAVSFQHEQFTYYSLSPSMQLLLTYGVNIIIIAQKCNQVSLNFTL